MNAPQREAEMRGEEGEKGGEGGMVMMCLHMICWIDITNHLVPMVTPLGRAHTYTHTHTLSLIQAILSHRNSDINLINISLLHLISFSKTWCIFKRLLICMCVCVCVCAVHVIQLCVRLPVHVCAHKCISASRIVFSCA